MKIRQSRNDVDNINRQKQLYKENAVLFNDYASIIELKENEKKQMLEDKKKLSDLEEQKLKSEFKAQILEDDNKIMFLDLLSEMKKK